MEILEAKNYVKSTDFLPICQKLYGNSKEITEKVKTP